jgi:hypothetical protein
VTYLKVLVTYLPGRLTTSSQFFSQDNRSRDRNSKTTLPEYEDHSIPMLARMNHGYSRFNSVGLDIRPRSRRPRDRGWIPGRGKKFFSYP